MPELIFRSFLLTYPGFHFRPSQTVWKWCPASTPQSSKKWHLFQIKSKFKDPRKHLTLPSSSPHRAFHSENETTTSQSPREALFFPFPSPCYYLYPSWVLWTMNFKNASGEYRQSSCIARRKQKLLQTQQRNLEAGYVYFVEQVAPVPPSHLPGHSWGRYRPQRWFILKEMESPQMILGYKHFWEQKSKSRKEKASKPRRNTWKQHQGHLERKQRFLAGEGKNSPRDRSCQNTN